MIAGAPMDVKIPYYWVDRWGNGYWTPKKHMREAGFSNIACGQDGPAARAKAMKWVEKWRDHKAGKAVDMRLWPEGSCGEAFERFKRTGEWASKAPRTREDWDRGFALIAPIFADRPPSEITLEDMSLWYHGDPDDAAVQGLLQRVSVREAHRAMKIWRALWQVMAAMKYCSAEQDPSFGIRRQTPKGRSARWSEGEVVRLVKRGLRMGFHDAACIVAILWDTQFSPVDGRTLAARHVRREGGRLMFDKAVDGREKTEKAVLGTLSRRTERLIERHLSSFTVDLLPDALLFKTREGAAYTKDTLSKDFRKIRKAEFGADESRQMIDLRRSGAVEALAGSVDLASLSHKMGNSLKDSKELQRTYLPVDSAVVSLVDEARLVGRRRMRKDSK